MGARVYFEGKKGGGKIHSWPLKLQHQEGMIWWTSKSHKRKKRLGFANDLYFRIFRQHRRKKWLLKHCIKEKLCGGFLIWKMLWKVRHCSEFHVKLQIRRRNAHYQALELDRGRIISYLSVDYCSALLPVVLVHIHPLSCKYGMNGLLRVLLNSMQDLNALPWLMLE